jgi:hypothetical protein
MDRQTNKWCSLISDDPRYRGGNNNAEWDGTHRTLLGKPASAISTTTMSVYARNRGLGWEANWYVSRAVMEYLFRIIMGTRHSQAAFNPDKDANGLFQGGLGPGVTQFSSWGAYNNTYPIIPCAAGVELADGVGVTTHDVTDETGAVIYTAQIPVFFGLKHLYGNLWSLVRGLIVDVEQGEAGDNKKTRTYVAPSMYDYTPGSGTDTTVEGMLLASEQPRAEGYIKKQSMNKLCCMPTEVGGSSSTFFADYFWHYPATYYGLRSRLCGGSADLGSSAGAFCATATAAVAVADTHVSLPLYFLIEKGKASPLGGT